MASVLAAILICTLVALTSAQEHDFEINEPDWGFHSTLNTDYTLHCNNSDLPVMTYDYIRWELPNKVMVNNALHGHKYRMTTYNGATNMRLTIMNVQESDTGVYICHVFERNQKDKRGYLLRGLNIGGHAYAEPFEQYRHNLMVAGICALALFVPLVGGCLIYRYRYQTDEERMFSKAARDRAARRFKELHEDQGYGNGSASGDKRDEIATYDNRAFDNGASSKHINIHL